MSKKQVDMMAGSVFLLIGIMMIYTTKDMKAVVTNDVGPAFLPQVIGGCLIALSIAKLIFAAKSGETKSVTNNQLLGKGLLTILLTGVYVMVFRSVGFIISSMIYLMIQTLLLNQGEKKSMKTIVAISMIAPIVIYFIFVNLLNLMLPAGILG